jgi:hypothetical protein
MSGTALDVILVPRLGAWKSARRQRVTIGDDVPVWFDVRDDLTGAVVAGATGVSAIYWLPSTVGSDSAAQPLEPVEVTPGTWLVQVPTVAPGTYVVWFSIEGPTRQRVEIPFDVSSFGDLTAGAAVTVPWSTVQAAAAAAGASAAVPEARRVATEVGAAAAVPAALEAIAPAREEIETKRAEVESNAADAAQSAAIASAATSFRQIDINTDTVLTIDHASSILVVTAPNVVLQGDFSALGQGFTCALHNRSSGPVVLGGMQNAFGLTRLLPGGNGGIRAVATDSGGIVVWFGDLTA